MNKNPESGATRREFTRVLALTAVAPLLLPSDSTPAEAEDPVVATADALVEIIRLRHGKHLSKEQMKDVQRGILRSVRSGERMRQVKLTNRDEPAFIFSADIP